jgi:signal transduction histidine kinase/streptogramin lyase
MVFFFCATIAAKAQSVTPSSQTADSVPNALISQLPVRVPLTDGRDNRFKTLTGSEGLSQTRVSSAVQDDLGFMWFPTQFGLNRYDGYKFKVFKHEPGRADSLSCVYIRSLIKDRAGSLWVGCDSVVDKFDPISETSTHYPIHTDRNTDSAGPVYYMCQDHLGFLWLATGSGLYKLEPSTGRMTRYTHDPSIPSSLSSNFVSTVDEDRKGELWVAGRDGLDAFDRRTGRVTLHIPLDGYRNQFSFHEDKFGTFWIARGSSSCPLSTFDRKTNTVQCYAFCEGNHASATTAGISSMFELRDGTMWFATMGAVLLRYNRNDGTLTRYRNDPADSKSLGSNNVLALYEDREGEIWVCMHDVEPQVFAERPSAFQAFTKKRGTLTGALVTTIFEDSDRILWIGSTGRLNRIDRQTGRNDVSVAKSDIMSIIEDRSGTLVAGTYRDGLQKLDRKNGLLTPYGRFAHKPSNQSENPIMRLLIDPSAVLWAATWGGLGRFDLTTGNFVTFRPDTRSAHDYFDVKQDSRGGFWLGGESGLQYYEPETHHFTIYKHNPDDLQSLSDDRVNSVHLARSGEIWVGTQNGLDKLDEKTGKFRAYYTKNGLSGNVVSCILEDDRDQLWMGTNNGVSTLDPKTLKFTTYSSADGLPGQDLTGWFSCHKSTDGEMFFGGFSGVVAFYPDRVREPPYTTTTVLTDFRLSGVEVPVDNKSPLKKPITYTDSVTLTNKQNIFSFEFSALSYLNSTTNRYRYKLEGLDGDWHEVDSSERIASYTTLPKGHYTLRVQSATSRGPWSEPGAMLRIEILPAWYQTFWFRCICVTAFLLLLWAMYLLRLNQLKGQFSAALEARVDERTRIARELHDTLLQSFQGLLLVFQAISNVLPARPDEAKQRIEHALDQASDAITEGRDAVHELRSGGLNTMDLGEAISKFGKDLLSGATTGTGPEFGVQVGGTPQPLSPIIRDEVYRIGVESLRNAVRHANARRIEVDIRYSENGLRLRIRDDGKGIDQAILGQEQIAGHWGLRGMRERAKLVGGTFEVWSQVGSGTEAELTIPAASAYAKLHNPRGFALSWLWRR